MDFSSEKNATLWFANLPNSFFCCRFVNSSLITVGKDNAKMYWVRNRVGSNFVLDDQLQLEVRGGARVEIGSLQQGIFDENGGSSQDEGGEQVHVNVVPHAVQLPEKRKSQHMDEVLLNTTGHRLVNLNWTLLHLASWWVLYGGEDTAITFGCGPSKPTLARFDWTGLGDRLYCRKWSRVLGQRTELCRTAMCSGTMERLTKGTNESYS